MAITFLVCTNVFFTQSNGLTFGVDSRGFAVGVGLTTALAQNALSATSSWIQIFIINPPDAGFVRLAGNSIFRAFCFEDRGWGLLLIDNGPDP